MAEFSESNVFYGFLALDARRDEELAVKAVALVVVDLDRSLSVLGDDLVDLARYNNESAVGHDDRKLTHAVLVNDERYPNKDLSDADAASFKRKPLADVVGLHRLSLVAG